MMITPPRLARLLAVILGLMAASAAPAKADPLVFNFSYELPGSSIYHEASASGTLTTNSVANSDGSYTIIGITGTRTFNNETDNITGLLTPGTFPSGSSSNDNELYPISTATVTTYLDGFGFSFTIDGANNGDLGNQINLFAQNGNYYEDSSSTNHGSFSLTAVSVPEPTSLVSAGLATMIGLPFAWRRRRARAIG